MGFCLWWTGELSATRYCCGITSFVVQRFHQKYIYIWNRGFCLQGTFVLYRCCVPVYFWKTIFYMCDWTLHCSIICDTINVYIIRRWICFSHVVCTIGFYMMSIIFIERALLELDIFMRVCAVFLRDVMTFTYYVLFRNFIFMYVMPYISTWCQLYLHTTPCPGTWYFMRDSVVYFYVMSLASIYCEHSGNLIFYVRQCHLSTT